MGKKGEKRSQAARLEAEAVVAELSALPATSRGMFGGYGIFRDGIMFGLVNSAGLLFFRVNDATRPSFEAEASVSHGRMPYWSVPPRVRADPASLVDWATQAAEVARAAKGAKK